MIVPDAGQAAPSPNDHPFLVLSAEDDAPLCTSVLVFGGRKPAGQDRLADCASSQQRVILAEIPGGEAADIPTHHM